MNNLLWSVHFAQNRLKIILRVTAITFVVILIGDIVFIPMYTAKGAALVYLVATVIEYLNYMRSSSLSKFQEAWLSPFVCLTGAIASGLIATYISDSTIIRLCVAIPAFSVFLIATKQIQKSDLGYIFQLFGNKQRGHSF